MSGTTAEISMASDAPAAPARAGARPAAPVRARRGPKPGPLVALGLFLAFAGWFGWRWWSGRAYETSDNAQVEGHVTPVLPRVGGFVARVMVADNQPVKAGDTLVVIDDRDLRARLAQADAELAALEEQVSEGGGQAVAQAAAARAQAGAARAAIAQAEANALKARRDMERMGPLAARNIVSRQQFDAVVAAAGAAEAQVAAARENAAAAGSQAEAVGAGVQVARSRVAAARAARDGIALQLSYAVVTAPADGVVARKSVEPGQMVNPGQPLMSVVPLGDVWVTANLKETQTRDLRPGEEVEVEVDAYPGYTFHGRVESISPATGARFSLLPPDNATGNFTKVVQRIPVRIALEGKDAAHPLRPGMSAEVRIRAR